MSRWPAPAAAVILAALVGLAACSPARLVNSVTPSASYLVERDVPYGDDPRQRLDLYRPTRERPGAPLVVFFYGGSWKFGDRGDYRFVAEALTSRGYAVAVPDYRVYPAVRFPAFLEDCAAAVRKAQALAGGRRVVLMGHSAGAYNAAMLTLDPRWLGGGRTGVAGFIGLAGPYDFLPLGPEFVDVFAPAKPIETSQPISFAGGAAPPVLLITGGKDDVVEPRNTDSLAKALQGQGNRVTAKVYPRLGHVLLIGTVSRPFRWVAPVLGDVEAFLDGLDG